MIEERCEDPAAYGHFFGRQKGGWLNTEGLAPRNGYALFNALPSNPNDRGPFGKRLRARYRHSRPGRNRQKRCQ